jgi:TonB family protein
MGAGSQAQTWSGASRRRVPRFPVHVPVDVITDGAGVMESAPGRSLNIGECGIAAVIAGELIPGQKVSIEVHLPALTDPLSLQATVRYQDSLCCGFEFSSITAEQRAAIRDWARGRETVLERYGSDSMKKQQGDGKSKKGSILLTDPDLPTSPGYRRPWVVSSAVLTLVLLISGGFWWKWNHDWEQLESGLNAQAPSDLKPQLQVPTDLMQKLLIHRVEPVYPLEARKDNLQGVIALEVVIGRDGSVASMRPLNGPAVLARAAMDAMRWWKFTPYRINGEPAVVETTVAVEFKR